MKVIYSVGEEVLGSFTSVNNAGKSVLKDCKYVCMYVSKYNQDNVPKKYILKLFSFYYSCIK